MNQKKVELIETRACKLIEKELHIKRWRLVLRMRPEEEQYENDLKCFRLLFHHPDPAYKMALWNGLHVFYGLVKEEDFTAEELEFLKKASEASRNRCDPDCVNVNKPIKTERLCLCSPNEEDLLNYHMHLKNDGDFTMFTCLKYSKEIVEMFSLEGPFTFAIQEKVSGKMIGYIGLKWEETFAGKSDVAKLEYYIFKEYRGKGYAKEAVLAICRRAFDGKLYELQETNYKNIYRKKKAKFELIRASIRNDNIPSRRLVEACGFSHSGTLHRDFVVENKYHIDKEIYELIK